MSSINATEARAALPELLTRVQGGEEVTITRHGQAVAVLVHPDALHNRRARAALEGAGQVHALIAEAGRAGSATSSGLARDRAEELIREINANRD